jgi:putative intracellular protease/amidase
MTCLAAVTVFAQPATAAKEEGAKNVAILLFQNVQIIDYTGPYEVFNSAVENGNKRFKVYTVAEKSEPITTIGGMTVIPKYNFGNHPKIDILVVPGGWGVNEERKNPTIIQWIQQTAKEADVVFSICNGAFLLSEAGLLEGLSATTTARGIPRLKEEVPTLTPIYDKRFVDNGKIVTAAGLSAGIDGALHVVEKVLGKGWAQKIAVDMEYNWQPESRYARALLADLYVPGTWWLLPNMAADPVSYEGGEDYWQSKAIVQSSLSAAQILAQVNDKLPNAPKGKWMRQDSAKSGNAGVNNRWGFTDENGKAWKALVSVEPIPQEQGKVMLTIKIARADSAMASRIK